MSLILILYFKGLIMLTTLGTMLLKNRKLTNEEVEEKARIRKKLIEESKAVKDNNEALIALLQTITNEQQCLVTLAKLSTDSDSWSHYLSSGVNPDIPLVYLYQYYRYAINAANDIAGDNIDWANDNSGKLSSRYTWEFNQRGGQQWLL